MLAANPVAKLTEFRDVDLDHLARVHANDQIARPRSERELIVSLSLIDQDALDDPGVLHQPDRAINGRLGNPMASLAERVLDILSLENSVEADDRIEDLRPFGGVLLPLSLESPTEDRADRLEDLDVVGDINGRCGFEGHRRMVRGGIRPRDVENSVRLDHESTNRSVHGVPAGGVGLFSAGREP